jgi:hypothetical protein
MQHMHFFYAMDLAPEGAPIEALPVPVLQINEGGQNQKHNRTGHNAFSIHQGKSTSRRGPSHAKRETASPKVND